ncbi:MAG: glutamate--tRNA ligase [Flavobacteriia bacterium]|nr:MAG: glutamate--tRNA ligase [Flavobacteriia bacterium]
MSKPVRVRFAPSPTGPLHIGGVRTALFNYLFAKKNKGTFILRIEDTDQNRYVANAEQYIIDALNWSGIPFEEGPGKEGNFGPYRQSERKDLYKQYADRLIAEGKAYYAFDTPEELDALRSEYQENKQTFIYNYHNREKLNNSVALSEEEVAEKLENGEKYVVRFKTPVNKDLQLKDMIRGDIKIDTNTLDDKILFKSDGMPTYHLANIVDDHLMEITHVIRGEEWLPSMALHVLLYQAFDWDTPEFAHLPLILKPTGKGKLSKRDGDKLGFPVFPLEYKNETTGEISRGYREDGYFPEAFINMLAFLGWNPGTEQELFNMEELIEAFDISKVGKSGAKFDVEKTKWFQHQYLIRKEDQELAKMFSKEFKDRIVNSRLHGNDKVNNLDYITKIVSLIKERASFVSDFWSLSSYFFIAPESYDPKAVKKAWKSGTGELMKELTDILKSIDDFSAENTEKVVKEWITSKEIGFGKVMQPFRLSLVGALQGPHVFDITALLGKEETLKRLTRAIDTLS